MCDEEYIKSVRNDIAEERLHDIVKNALFDSYATSFFQEQTVRMLVESGITVTAWHRLGSSANGVTIHIEIWRKGAGTADPATDE